MSVENFADRLREHQERMAKRPEIEVVAGKLPEVVDQAEDALIERGLSIYQRGNKLVRPIRAGESAEDGIRRRKGALTLQIVTLPGLCEAFDLAAAFAKYDGRTKSLRPIDCPEKIAKTYLARAGRWRLPELLGIVEAPTLRRDGSILDKPGYDDSSGLLFDPGELEPLEIPEQPSRDEALAALALLTDLIRDFPFKSDADRSVAIAAMLTALIRSSLRSAPMLAFTAPTMGSGKSLLADCIARIATGRDAPAMSQGTSREEDQKVILALLIAGDPIVLLDNCAKPIQGDALCTVLTQARYRGRLLGTNEQITVPTAVTFMSTGNNLIFKGDMTTRALVCEIDPNCERPEERSFDRDLRKYIAKHRAQLVAAALTMLRAYVVAKRPSVDIMPFGRFEEWSDWIRSALVWLGEADPCETRERLFIDDPERSELQAVMEAWRNAYGDEKVLAKEITGRAAKAKADGYDEAGTELAEALRGAISDPADARKFGYWIKRNAGKIVNGLRLQRAGEHRTGNLWRCIRQAPVR